MKARRKRTAQTRWARLAVPGALWLALGVCAWGFVRLARIALYRQAHGVPGAEHPYDFGADGCLVLAMAAVALLLLTRPVRGQRWRRARRFQPGPGTDLARARGAKARGKRVQ